jgi:CrcB protein
MNLVLVFVGGAIGAMSRFRTDRAIQSRHARDYPFGTLVVNVLGCAILGALTGLSSHFGWSPQIGLLLGAGFCGGLTTFSTFSVETVTLAGRDRIAAVGYLTISLLAGIGVATTLWWLTSR